MANNLLEKVVSLCKRRGFVFPNSEIYGGVRGIYDFGPVGVEMVNNLKKLWWQEMVQKRENVVGIDGAIITHPRVWEASGHVKNFTDPLVECQECHKRFRQDEIKGKKCPACGGSLSEPRKFNILVEAKLGVLEEEKQTYYLRGEACQTIYLDYENVLRSTRQRIPFGIAQIGKAFRNEITPKNFLFRQREFEQWDMQFFTSPKEMEKWFAYWKEERFLWYQKLLNHKKNIRFREHGPEELAHYIKRLLPAGKNGKAFIGAATGISPATANTASMILLTLTPKPEKNLSLKSWKPQAALTAPFFSFFLMLTKKKKEKGRGELFSTFIPK